jgi:endonuclease/exonuclease/phosphatase family metal-dependent hydrolase
MKKTYLFVVVFAILFLFFIQMAGTLVESIYILDLMHTSLDAKALGVLFFFAPVFLLLFRRKTSNGLVWSMSVLLFLARGATPYLGTYGRMLASGIATAAALLLFVLIALARPKGESSPRAGSWIAAGLALAVALSVLFRTLNFSIDYSLTASGSWVGWLLGALFVLQLTQMEWSAEPSPRGRKSGLTGALVGLFLILTLVYFAFSAPAVIARWTQGSYALIVIAVSLLAAAWAWLAVARLHFFDRLPPLVVLLWNLLFTASLVGTILAHHVPFPRTPESPAVVVGTPAWIAYLPLVLMLLLFPVIFLDLRLLVDRVRRMDPSPRDLAPGMLLGGAFLVLLVFINIFTNVWGYIEPVSTPFRNLFWLPFLLIAGTLTLLVGWKAGASFTSQGLDKFPLVWSVLIGVVFLGTLVGVLRTGRPLPVETGKSSLVVMTYNIQAGNDGSGEASYDRQLALIRQVSPDVLALQESDTARISLNNNDYVLYFASRLGYYSYYGPTTVTGTFGTAILSRYPLLDTHTVFTYSDQDEIGTTEAAIEVAGRRFSLYDVHPDGSDTAMLVWAESLLERSQDQPNVIALGDYNLRDYEEAYQLIDAVYTNTWVSLYPSKISPDGIDMSGDNRIDHIFVSPSLSVRDAFYVLPPASATDHAVHWAGIVWGE